MLSAGTTTSPISLTGAGWLLAGTSPIWVLHPQPLIGGVNVPYEVVDAGGGVDDEGLVSFHGAGRFTIPTGGDVLDVFISWPVHGIAVTEHLAGALLT